MQSVTSVLRHRKPRPGPELDMLASALHSGLPTGFAGSAEILREPELPIGSPDVVAVFPRGTQRQPRTAPTTAHTRILHQLWLLGGVRVPDLARLLHISARRLNKLVGDLTDMDLVWRRGSYCVTRSLDRILPVRQIVAVEAKISDWRTGLDQAESNLWFASVSYLLLPHRKELAATALAAADRGVGLLVYDGRRVRRMVHPRPVQIPRSYDSWLFSESLIQGWSQDKCST